VPRRKRRELDVGAEHECRRIRRRPGQRPRAVDGAGKLQRRRRREEGVLGLCSGVKLKVGRPGGCRYDPGSEICTVLSAAVGLNGVWDSGVQILRSSSEALVRDGRCSVCFPPFLVMQVKIGGFVPPGGPLMRLRSCIRPSIFGNYEGNSGGEAPMLNMGSGESALRFREARDF
jgi:hypothetical protein